MEIEKYREQVEKQQKREKARDELQLETSRVILIRECNHYIAKGYAPLYAVSSISAMFKAYKEFGGNGGVEELYEEFRKLPHVAKSENL